MEKEFDVLIIGGGATGAGTARDCALRGLRVLLVEREDIATGATGRNHGLLHSGARYAVTDPESARECIGENLILKRIARHCVEDTGGLFLTLPEDDLDYQRQFVTACTRAGIRAEAIEPKEAIRMEPSVNRSLIGAVKVPDGSVDPFRLTSSNLADARLHGAETAVYTEVTGFLREQDRICGIRATDRRTGETVTCRARVVVNACGIWGQHIAELAGVKVDMFPAKGALLIFAHRVNGIVLNRCRKPANADILVPGDTICIIGTTSTRVPFEECDHVRVTPDEVDLLLTEGARLAPALSDTRILRAYAGVRPLVSADDDPTGRNISRGIVLLDHETRDGLKGLITITGGKLMTYRLMAEKATDLICRKLHVREKCRTAELPLPGSEIGDIRAVAKKYWENPTLTQKAAAGRLGSQAGRIDLKDRINASLVCECEEVSVGEIEAALADSDVRHLTDLRRRTRLGMGTCQGGLCACRAACLLAKAGQDPDRAKADLFAFLQERWKGMYPIAWGETLREMEYTRWIYADGPDRTAPDRTAPEGGADGPDGITGKKAESPAEEMKS